MEYVCLSWSRFPILTLWIIGMACYLNQSSRSKNCFLSIHKAASIVLITVVYCASFFLCTKVWIKWNTYHNLYICLNAHNFREVFKRQAILLILGKRWKETLAFYIFIVNLPKWRIRTRSLSILLLSGRKISFSGFIIDEGWLSERKRLVARSWNSL